MYLAPPALQPAEYGLKFEKHVLVIVRSGQEHISVVDDYKLDFYGYSRIEAAQKA